MKKVYYKGEPYEFKTSGTQVGKRHFLLFRDQTLVHAVEEQELDKKSVVSIILDAYYNSISSLSPSAVLG